MKPRIGITVGDFNGVGPEIALKAIARPEMRELCTPILIGPFNIFAAEHSRLRIKRRLIRMSPAQSLGSEMGVIDTGDGIKADIHFGEPTKASGRNAALAVERAVELYKSRYIDAVVTAPVSKKALHLAGYEFPGQTEMIAVFSGTLKASMMLVAGNLRVGVITIHQPLSTVAQSISAEKIQEKIFAFHTSLRRDFGIKNPTIAVLGLNPHAGEDGLFGSEESQYLKPAIESLQMQGLKVSGPYSADGYFGSKTHSKYDLTVAMYHDQGLIPLKLIGFEKGVNLTVGVEIVRTSPDHGTAYEIAGTGKAHPESMIEAIVLAVNILKNRKKGAAVK